MVTPEHILLTLEINAYASFPIFLSLKHCSGGLARRYAPRTSGAPQLKVIGGAACICGAKNDFSRLHLLVVQSLRGTK